MKKTLSILLLSVITTACSSFAEKQAKNGNYLYLRSEFTWWEALDNYRFKAHSGSDNMSVNAKIFSDGNYYNIKIADKGWSQHSTCGPKLSVERDIILNQWTELNCSYDYDKLKTTPLQNAFRFKPSKSDIYTFEIKMTTTGPSHLRVKVAG